MTRLVQIDGTWINPDHVVKVNRSYDRNDVEHGSYIDMVYSRIVHTALPIEEVVNLLHGLAPIAVREARHKAEEASLNKLTEKADD